MLRIRVCVYEYILLSLIYWWVHHFLCVHYIIIVYLDVNQIHGANLFPKFPKSILWCRKKQHGSSWRLQVGRPLCWSVGGLLMPTDELGGMIPLDGTVSIDSYGRSVCQQVTTIWPLSWCFGKYGRFMMVGISIKGSCSLGIVGYSPTLPPLTTTSHDSNHDSPLLVIRNLKINVNQHEPTVTTMNRHEPRRNATLPLRTITTDHHFTVDPQEP